MTPAAGRGRRRHDMRPPAGGAAAHRRGKDVLNESLTVVDPHFEVLVLLQDVDDLVLQRQVLLDLRRKQNRPC